jgi:tRNA pseudouridine32 synthase/23S rRNA pseudouridine746 synthase
MNPSCHNPATRINHNHHHRFSPHFFHFNTLSYCPPCNNHLDLVYCDRTLLVVNKPAGLLAVPGRGVEKQDCLASRIQQEFPDALVVHRLDMATSGLMLFGRSTDMQRHLSQMFSRREVQKRYVAVVIGELEPASGEVNLPIVADWSIRPLRKIDAENGKTSLTRFRLLAHDEVTDTSRLELEPVTGRTHQLRVHMAAIGHPIVGDALYGAGGERLLLHSSRLGFFHPHSQDMLTFVSEPSF